MDCRSTVRKEEPLILPLYMQEGSTGPLVDLLLIFLAGYQLGTRGHTDVIPDGVCGLKGVAALQEFQADHDLQADGGFGPETRRYLTEAYALNFDVIAAGSRAATIFRQPDGSELMWPPRTPMVRDRALRER